MARKNDILSIYTKEVEDIREAGLFKGEAPIASAQGARVKLEDGREVINMCANNYLGLGDNQRLIDAAKRTYDNRGYGMASVRFICGTQDIHKELEARFPISLGQMIRFFTPPASMPMAACSRRFSQRTMRLSATS